MNNLIRRPLSIIVLIIIFFITLFNFMEIAEFMYRNVFNSYPRIVDELLSLASASIIPLASLIILVSCNAKEIKKISYKLWKIINFKY